MARKKSASDSSTGKGIRARRRSHSDMKQRTPKLKPAHAESAQKHRPRSTAQEKRTNKTESRGVSNSFPVVGIGASAGGLEAFTELLRHLPPDTGMAFVLVQHLDPVHESALTKILTKATSMDVRDVADNLAVEPNHVYVIPPNTTLSIAQGVLKLQPRKKRALRLVQLIRSWNRSRKTNESERSA